MSEKCSKRCYNAVVGSCPLARSFEGQGGSTESGLWIRMTCKVLKPINCISGSNPFGAPTLIDGLIKMKQDSGIDRNT